MPSFSFKPTVYNSGSQKCDKILKCIHFTLFKGRVHRAPLKVGCVFEAHTPELLGFFLLVFFLHLPVVLPFLFCGNGYNRVCADPDSKRTAFNNRHLTLQGVSVWFHCSRQSCLNITQTPPVPWQEAQSHCLHSSYFYWQQEDSGCGWVEVCICVLEMHDLEEVWLKKVMHCW